MIDSVEEACRLIAEHIPPAPSARLPLADADGLVTARPLRATGDSPPFDKSLMDGYAIRSADYMSGRREFEVLEEITAGQTASHSLSTGEAIRIMTGAPLPAGADCVIPVELSESSSNRKVTFAEAPRVSPEWNLARRGQSIRTGSEIIPAGTLLGPAQIGALAEMGIAQVDAIPQPTVAILATGDELVPFDALPGPGQIRNSNAIMLESQVRRAGGRLLSSQIARDVREDLKEKVTAGLAADFLILSGGVSAGVLDLVPSVLAECGCEKVFHGCNVKPGKPIWFGELPGDRSSDGRPRWIFGLPGNPVSSMVCFELFVRTGILRRRGISPATPFMQPARLSCSHVSKDSRPTYFPAVVSRDETGLVARPLAWQGSFDLQTVALANALVLFDSARERLAGEAVSVLLLD